MDYVLACDKYCIYEAIVDPDRILEPKSFSKGLPDGRIVSSFVMNYLGGIAK